jgi:hypothetical protein
VEEGVWRVCGGPEDCRRSGHKGLDDLGMVGTYETIKTSTYTDGLLETYRSREDEEERFTKTKALQVEAIQRLTGSKEYQVQLRAVTTELDDKEETEKDRESLGTIDNRKPGAWSEALETDASDRKAPARTTRSQSRTTSKDEGETRRPPSRDRESTIKSALGPDTRGSSGAQRRSKNVVLSSNKKETTAPPSKPDPTDIVVEIRDALKTMATTFMEVAKRTELLNQTSPSDIEGAGDSIEEDSDREGSNSRGHKRGSNRRWSGTGGKSPKTQWYYWWLVDGFREFTRTGAKWNARSMVTPEQSTKSFGTEAEQQGSCATTEPVRMNRTEV